jgi:hypothetical protein
MERYISYWSDCVDEHVLVRLGELPVAKWLNIEQKFQPSIRGESLLCQEVSLIDLASKLDF